MNAQAEELAQRIRAARIARVTVQRMRLLAAQRAEKLERDLAQAAETDVKAQIIRTQAARAQLQTVVRRKSVKRASGIAALALVLATGTAGLAWFGTQNAAATGQSARHAPVLGSMPGEPLKLAYSYSVSLPPAR
jgi:hypothetical protein